MFDSEDLSALMPSSRQNVLLHIILAIKKKSVAPHRYQGMSQKACVAAAYPRLCLFMLSSCLYTSHTVFSFCSQCQLMF